MSKRVTLAYGNQPCELELPDGAEVVEAPTCPPPLPVDLALERALDAPIQSAPLEALASPGARVLVIVSDATRADPRELLWNAVSRRLPASCDVRLAIANGTHGPAPLDRLGLDLRSVEVLNHDAFDRASMVEVGVTRRGTPLRVHRALVECDLAIATGVLRPHYFAGWGAGAKALFPGLGENAAIRANHRLKAEPGARAGEIDGNPCRADLEEIVDHLPCATFLLNVIAGPDDGCHGAVAGDVRAAFRAGVRQAAGLFEADAPTSSVIVASDALPITASLYQASKLVAAVAELVRDGGTVILAAECPEGTGPLDTVNRAIFELGIRPRLPARHRVVLASGLPRAVVERTYCAWAPSVEAALASCAGPPTVVPRAGHILLRPRSA